MNDLKTERINWLKRNVWLIFLIIATLILLFSIFINRKSDSADSVAVNVSHVISGRMKMLDSYMSIVASGQEWTELDGFPDDMVIYRYENDSLKSWYNQFTLDNDDISRRMYIPRFMSLRYNVVSPLSEVDTVVNYINIGPKWYLVKAKKVGFYTTIIGGLEIKNMMSSNSYNGVNRHLKVSDGFSLYPISYSGGAPIYVANRPLIKIIQENNRIGSILPNPIYIWISLFIILAALLYLLRSYRTFPMMWTVMLLNTIIIGTVIIFGKSFQSVSQIFSPTIYAQGSVLYSLASLLLLNLWIVVMITCIYLLRKNIILAFESKFPHIGFKLYAGVIICSIIALAIYIHLTLKGVIMNSNITLELYRISGITQYTVYVYISYMSLLIMLLVLIALLKPAVRKFYGVKYDVLSRTWRIIFSIISALYLLAMSSIIGFTKEKNRIDIWANRLAVDRNLGFELRLKGIETAIASDPVLPLLIFKNKDYRVVMRRIKESYLSKISQDYETTLQIFSDSDPVTETIKYYSERLRNGIAISDSSHFVYSRSSNGRAQYTGIFTYYNPTLGVTRLILGIDSSIDMEGAGYAGIIGDAGSGSVVVPRRYSYCKYLSGNLISYGGVYPYSTVFSGKFKEISDDLGSGSVIIGDYIHFVNRVSNNETIVISERKVGFVKYMVSGFLIALLAFFSISIPTIKKIGKTLFEKNYYKTRINTVLYLSLFATLIAMTSVSVLFIYSRNEKNMMEMMTGKINTIQSFIAARSSYLSSYHDYEKPEFSSLIEKIGVYTKSDVSLYTPEGKVFRSTSPEIFERLLLGSRLNEDAYKAIMYRNKRYFIHKEKFAGYSYYAMYAPVINNEGKKLAIICAPYTDSGLDFKEDAVFHAIFIITVFLILVVVTRILSSKVIERMFRPLLEMGVKMNLARENGLEYIIYERDDEITSLVRSYNLMVHDLYESSKQAAQLERNKAWNEMARQVAHEIKNPLTPIKLQIQRIIRMKQKHAPDWEAKFDTIVPVIMNSIDSLTDTANEFSTFAKLYSEPSVLIDIDELASSQVMLFSGRENIIIQYIGLKNAMVIGPKPQLTRVFVNLLTNAIQAIENKQQEDFENNIEPKPGLIRLSVRNSIEDGYYDVVIEDNGPGVKDEDRNKLFTPNFTTKSSGTGLGLAICKNILELCGGAIQYSRSFSLQGACFTFRIPKYR